MGEPNFWDNPDEAQKVAQVVTQLKDEVGIFRSLERRAEDLEVMLELAMEEEDADIVLGLYRDSYYRKDKKKDSQDNIDMLNSEDSAEIIVLKNRDGKTGTAHVAFDGNSVRFIAKKETNPLIIEFEK